MRVVMQRSALDDLLAHARKGWRRRGREVIGWLVGFEAGGRVNVSEAVPCTAYRRQSRFGAEADPLEEAKVAGGYPRSVGIVGLYHSHPSMRGHGGDFRHIHSPEDVFHSGVDDRTLATRAGKDRNRVSVVTNGEHYRCYAKGNGVGEVPVELTKRISYRTTLHAFRSSLAIQYSKELEDGTGTQAVAELARAVTEHVLKSLRGSNLQVEEGRGNQHFIRALPFEGEVAGSNLLILSREGDQQILGLRAALDPVIYAPGLDHSQARSILRNEIVDDITYLLWQPLVTGVVPPMKKGIQRMEVHLGRFEVTEGDPLPTKTYTRPDRTVTVKRSK
jgi:hypothetical protein